LLWPDKALPAKRNWGRQEIQAALLAEDKPCRCETKRDGLVVQPDGQGLIEG
jgi:hypothetical protein